MKVRKLFSLFLLGLAWALPGAADDSVPAAVDDEATLERLKRGEIVVENARTDESGGAVRVQALLHAQWQEVWEFIADCESVFRYVDGMRQCELLDTRIEGQADVSRIHQAVKKSWLTPLMEYTIEVRREPPSRVDFKLLEGDLKSMEGGWRFVETGDGLLVTHEIRVRPSFPVPRWLVRRSMRKDIPDMLACLRGLVDGSGPQARNEDLARCPKVRRKD
ncbi:MAG: hypothetical protein HKO64_12705 [Xanthomonadales bacterium]|nr:hypothetical protein [Xanthomonadales bacterium]NNL96474.1 hypothetical protein [Xanthomonadales bacterium]